MSNEVLNSKILNLEIMVSDLKIIVMNQCVTILNLIDVNREIKKLLESKSKSFVMKEEK